MQYYLVLTISTILILVLTFFIWEKTRSISFPVGIFFLYYWSLYGGWSLVTDKLGGDSGMHYYYLEDKLFPIQLDDNYFWALVLYAIFIIIIEITLLLVLKNNASSEHCNNPIQISHSCILIMGGISGLVSYLIIRADLQTAAMLNMSAYLATRGGLGEVSPLFTIHQELNRVALVPTAIGFAVLCSGKDARLLNGKVNLISKLGYILLLVSMFMFCALIGNKNELFFASLSGLLFYIDNTAKPRYLLLTVIACISLIGMWLVDMVRGFAISDVVNAFGTLDSSSWFNLLQFGATSNEAFGAHFSMYGALHYDLPTTYGSSIISLAASIVPRFFWADRPNDIYVYYADGVGAAPGQGYAVHHATGWYLNFGVMGVIIGALIFGWVWGKSFNLRFYSKGEFTRWSNIFRILAPWMIVAYIPSLVRAGPEAYKGLIIEGFLLPVIAITFASSVCQCFLSYQKNISAMDSSFR